MAELETVTVSNLPNAATPLTGGERILLDQATGPTMAASLLVIGRAYRIEALGNTNWHFCGVPSGVAPAVGLTFRAAAPGNGTGTAIEVRTVDAPVQAIAEFVGAGSGEAPSAYVHTQSTPASTWTINHNLGYRPSVELLDTGSQEIDGSVSHPTINQTVIGLNPPTAGLARLI